MRSILLAALIAGTAVIAWLTSARSVSELLDCLHPVPISSQAISQLRYDNGVFEIAGLRLDTFTPETMPSGLTAVVSPEARVSICYQGHAFPAGRGHPDLTFSPDPGDSVTFTSRRSYLSWPTPFQMNFMTGSAPSWKRHLYWQLLWTKRNHASLEILWRFEQGYFNPDGWRPQTVEYVTAGLFRARITLAND